MTAQEFAAKYMGKQVRTNPNCGNIYGVVVRADGNFVYIKTSRSDADGWYPDNLRPVEDEQPTAPLTAREIATKYAGRVATATTTHHGKQTGRIIGYHNHENWLIIEDASTRATESCSTYTITISGARDGWYATPESIVIHNTQPITPALEKKINPAYMIKTHLDEKPNSNHAALLTRAISIINGVNWDRQTKAGYEQARALVRDIAVALGKK